MTNTYQSANEWIRQCPQCQEFLCAGEYWSGDPEDGPDYVEYCPDKECGYWEYV